MKPIVAASQESLILAGKQLIESHVYTMCGVVNVDEPKEVVIYIKGMTAEELADFQDAEGTAPIRLPRYKEDGSRSKRDFNGFTYQGETYATSRALQTVRIRAVRNDGESRITTYWRPISILGELKESLILTNETADITRENTRKRSTEENYGTGDRLMKFNAKLNGKPGVVFMDLGSEVSIVDRRWLEHLREGRDFKYIKDIKIHSVLDDPLPTEGTIRVFAPAGLELTKGMKRSGFEACVVNQGGNKTWDMMVGRNFRGISTMKVPINSLFNGEVEKPVDYKVRENLKKGEVRKISGKERQRTHTMDTSRLRKVPGSKDKLWDSKDGKVTNIRLPCGYHKSKGMTPEECLESPRHCYECSRPNKIAPPVRECTGRHQYRPSTPRKRTPPSSNNGDKEEEAFKSRKEKAKNEREEYTGARKTTEEYTTQKSKNTPPRNKRPVNKEVEEAEMNPTEEKLRSSAPSIEETKDYSEYLRKLKYQEDKELQYQEDKLFELDTSGEPWDETEDGAVMIQEPAEPEKPKVEPTPRSYGIIEMIAQASYEQEEFDGRITLAKAAKGLQLEPEEELDLDRLKLIQARRLERATPKEREEELAQDALAAEILEDSMKRETEHDEARATIELEEQVKLKDLDKARRLEEEQVNLREFQEDIDRLEIIKARRNKMAKLKEMEAEREQDAIAAKILEDFMKRKAEHDKAKAAGELKETKEIEEKLENQEEAEDGAPDEPESM